MSAAKYIVLITGANGGIGFELARQLLADSTKHVLLGSRSKERGEAAMKELQSQKLEGTVELLQLDVTDEGSIEAAATNVEKSHGRLDALVNNAALGFPEGTLSQKMQQAFLTNAIGPALMGEAFESLLRKSIGTPRVVNVTSGAGSISGRLRPSHPMYKMKGVLQYGASKAAMNMVTADQSVFFGEFGAKVFAFCPGYTVSNLSDMNTAEKGARSTAESVAPIVKLLNGARDAEHGGFLHSFPDEQYGW